MATPIGFATIKTLGFASITASYVAVGTPFSQAISMFRIINNTDGDMLFTTDSTRDELFVPALSFVLYDLSANSPPQVQGGSATLVQNTQFYVKESTAPSKGAVWIEGLYLVGV